MIGDLTYPVLPVPFCRLHFALPDLFLTGNWLVYLALTFGVLVTDLRCGGAGDLRRAKRAMASLAGRGWKQSCTGSPWLGTARH